MNSKKILLVFNNEAGKSNYRQKKLFILKMLKDKKCLFKAINLANLEKEKLEDYSTVVTVGGDGTILRVIPFIANKDIRLCIIPCGTANLFAAHLCIPFNIKKAVDVLFNGKSTTVDLGKAGDEYFALRIGLGYDADIINGTKRVWKKRIGYLAYLIQGVLKTFKLSNKAYKITMDNNTFVVNANAIIVANAGNMFKNFFTVAPKGSVIDGKLDVFIMATKNTWEFVFAISHIVFKTHKKSSNIIYGQVENIKIEAQDKKLVHIDGEPFAESILDISVIPQALRVAVPELTTY